MQKEQQKSTKNQQRKTKATVQDVSMFSEEEIKKFQKSQTESHDTPISKTCETDKSKKCGKQNSCTAGSCSHPRSRNWVACEKCTEWHHCLCAGIPRTTAKKDDYHYICHFCSQ
ncbi:lysine-specific demethylase 5B-B-like [Dysidea avara]|uniref:lysine-specific demethylase 5B-B-like n=1 Tax=Dysidea avara TaxID=196820 RepID=UPI003323EE02